MDRNLRIFGLPEDNDAMESWSALNLAKNLAAI